MPQVEENLVFEGTRVWLSGSMPSCLWRTLLHIFEQNLTGTTIVIPGVRNVKSSEAPQTSVKPFDWGDIASTKTKRM